MGFSGPCRLSPVIHEMAGWLFARPIPINSDSASFEQKADVILGNMQLRYKQLIH